MSRMLGGIAARRTRYVPPANFPPRARMVPPSWRVPSVEMESAASRVVLLLKTFQAPAAARQSDIDARSEALTALGVMRRALRPVSWVMLDLILGRGMSRVDAADYLGERPMFVTDRFHAALAELCVYFCATDKNALDTLPAHR